MRINPCCSSIPSSCCTQLFITVCYQKHCRIRVNTAAVMVTVLNTKSRFLPHLSAKKRSQARMQRALETRKQEKNTIRMPGFWLQWLWYNWISEICNAGSTRSSEFGNLGIFRILLFRFFFVAVNILDRWGWKNPEELSSLWLQTHNSAIPERPPRETC